MKSYKVVLFSSILGKYTVNHIRADDISGAMIQASNEFKKDYPAYSPEIFSVERIDHPLPLALYSSQDALSMPIDSG